MHNFQLLRTNKRQGENIHVNTFSLLMLMLQTESSFVENELPKKRIKVPLPFALFGHHTCKSSFYYPKIDPNIE